MKKLWALGFFAAAIAPSPAAGAEELATAEDPPGLLKCSVGSLESCQAGRESVRLWYRSSLEGTTSAQRWMAKCYTDGCNGAVQKNRPLACAWRLVIVKTGELRTQSKTLTSEVNDADVAAKAKACDALSPQETKTAEAGFSWLLHFSSEMAGLHGE
jgi:hypothetical protein